MFLRDILSEMQVDFECDLEKEFKSLGLAGYNNDDAVCTFIDNEKYIQELSGNISMVITTKKIAKIIRTSMQNIGICIVVEPRLVFFYLHNFLSNKEYYKRDSFDTKIGENCEISPMAVIAEKNVTIGNNVIIEEFVTIKENTVIGDNTIIRANCVIGGQGFEFKKDGECVFRVNHIGGVIIGKNVEIQYSTCIDNAIYPCDNTILDDYVKLDNFTHIAHAVKIGKRTESAAGTIVGGRAIIGEDTWLGLNVTIRNGLSIGNNARANIGAVVTKNIDDYMSVTGNFAIDHKLFINKMKHSKS